MWMNYLSVLTIFIWVGEIYYKYPAIPKIWFLVTLYFTGWLVSKLLCITRR